MEEASKLKSYGKSLLVPSVQELAKGGVQDVPSRYVRPDIELLAVPADASLQSIPVINLDKLLDGTSMDSEFKKLHSACQEWGFFKVVSTFFSTKLEIHWQISCDEFEYLRIFSITIDG